MAVNPAPESRVLCVARESFELGEPLSGAAATRIEQAWGGVGGGVPASGVTPTCGYRMASERLHRALHRAE